ncbi:PREDICTED: tetraspanin-33-like [Priapulus caudatus]|uniref:Tetraspanin n=1 Tax=Priapulus caudatus TaxID=37621 RepID=A0ABM1EMP7_PRICU|nr:PREDICTED: tetraspanin-33-like [Priapulus caudatus]
MREIERSERTVNSAYVCGGFMAAIGLYAFVEKEQAAAAAAAGRATTTYALLDPATLMLIAGSVAFVVAFLGCTGALRENTCLLRTYTCMMIVLFIGVVATTGATFTLLLSEPGSTRLAPDALLRRAIALYQHDSSLSYLIDALQKKLQCCGVGPGGYRDWNLNPTFNCSDSNPAVERCGVPASCCRMREGHLSTPAARVRQTYQEKRK